MRNKVNEMRFGPEPTKKYAKIDYNGVCFIKNLITKPNIFVGDYSYCHSEKDAEKFEENVLYNYIYNTDKLVIGKFCSIASGAKFLMNSGNHRVDAFTTYPFPIFGQGWDDEIPEADYWEQRGDIVVGNDVWIGFEALIMAGVTIGDGAIIGARSVVTKDVPPYTIVAGSPARVIKQRFPDEVVEKLLMLRWWDWEIEKVTEKIPALLSGDLGELEKLIDENEVRSS